MTGGSQGAASLNRAVFGAAASLRAAGIQVLHVVGPKAGDVEVPPGPAPYVVLPYLDRMDLGYAAADFALCRAGAMTCAELTAVGLPAAYVPLPHGNGEQRLNAEPIEQAGGGLIIADGDLSPEWIVSTLQPILADGELVAAMAQAAAATGNRTADEDLAALVLQVGRRRPGGAGCRRAGRQKEAGMGLVTPVDPVPVAELGRVHFAAIGGAGMSGIARIMLARGVTVSGSDSADSPLLAELAAAGARVTVGHAAENLG